MAVRPEIGDPLRPCLDCPAWEFGGAPGCARCAGLVDALVEEQWRAYVGAGFGELSAAEQTDVARMVADEPHRHDWCVVDAALDRLRCDGCGGRLGSGPVSCGSCEVAHGFRYAAIETDRPGAPQGNEHAVRVNVSVVRRPQVTSAQELLARRLLLPALLVGRLPSTAQAQRFSAALKEAVARVGETSLAHDPTALARDPALAALVAGSDFPQLFGPALSR
ncbi:hypothetical protein [Catellatospora vulcania]|uniref:hypothetical protein n=1 Tax=Catellatospora vulcania TaxID=1460450 RepID=UPI0018AFB06A|nr:hypothetical protein [Catellatospora vulcania]